MAEVDSSPPVVDVEPTPAPVKVSRPPSSDLLVKPPSAGQLKVPTPPATVAPAAAGSGSIMSKLSSLKERRSSTQQAPAAPTPLVEHITTVPENETTEPSSYITSLAPAPAPAPAPARKPRSQSSRVPKGTVDGPVQPAPTSKIPNMSPQRLIRPNGVESARSASSVERTHQQQQHGSQGSLSPLRDGGWNQYSREARAARPAAVVSGPSDEERAKRRMWAQEKRRKEESRLRSDAARRQADIERKKQAEESKLEARRAFVRERIAKQHEIQARVAAERITAEERARNELAKFRNAKPLYERLIEEYERTRQAEEEAKKRQFEEEVLRVKHVRPHQIIAGEVVIKPTHPSVRDREISPGRERDPPAPVGGSAFSAGRHAVPVAGGHPPAQRSSQGGDYHPSVDSPQSVAASMPAAPAPKQFREKPRTQGMVLYSTRPKAGPAALPGILPRLMERGVSPMIFNSESAPINVPDQSLFWPSTMTRKVPEVPNILTVDPAASYDDAPAQASPTEVSPDAITAPHAEEHYDDDFGESQPQSPAMDITLAPAVPDQPTEEQPVAGSDSAPLLGQDESAAAETGEVFEGSYEEALVPAVEEPTAVPPADQDASSDELAEAGEQVEDTSQRPAEGAPAEHSDAPVAEDLEPAASAGEAGEAVLSQDEAVLSQDEAAPLEAEQSPEPAESTEAAPAEEVGEPAEVAEPEPADAAAAAPEGKDIGPGPEVVEGGEEAVGEQEPVAEADKPGEEGVVHEVGEAAHAPESEEDAPATEGNVAPAEGGEPAPAESEGAEAAAPEGEGV